MPTQKERPIIMSGPMVLSILADLKTNTRRLNKSWLKVKKGDILYVRESLYYSLEHDNIYFKADNKGVGIERFLLLKNKFIYSTGKIKKSMPSRFMPRCAARIYLEATADAREEWLQDISEEDAIKEGFKAQIPNTKYFHRSARGEFKIFWNYLNPKAPWCSSPEVVVLEFCRKK